MRTRENESQHVLLDSSTVPCFYHPVPRYMPGAKQKSRLRTMRNDLFNAHVYTEIKTHTDRIAVTFTYYHHRHHHHHHHPPWTKLPIRVIKVTCLLGRWSPKFCCSPSFCCDLWLKTRRQWFHRVDIAFETCFISSSSWILTFLTDCSVYDQCQDRRPHPPTPMPHPRNKVLVRGPVASYFG